MEAYGMKVEPMTEWFCKNTKLLQSSVYRFMPRHNSLLQSNAIWKTAWINEICSIFVGIIGDCGFSGIDHCNVRFTSQLQVRPRTAWHTAIDPDYTPVIDIQTNLIL